MSLLRFVCDWQATKPCMGSAACNLLMLFSLCQAHHPGGQQSNEAGPAAERNIRLSRRAVRQRQRAWPIPWTHARMVQLYTQVGKLSSGRVAAPFFP